MTIRGDNADLRDFLEKVKTDQERRAFFAIALMNPSFHWFFTQGQQALEAELYVPGVSCIPAICCACASWNALNVNGVMSSVASGWRAFHRLKASTHSTLRLSLH